MKLQIHKVDGNTFNITEQANSPKILLHNLEIKDTLKTITETQENLKETVNTPCDDSLIISNKIKTFEDEIAKNQVKINEYIELEKKIEDSVEEKLWKLVVTNTENKWHQIGKKEKLLTSKNNHTNSGESF